MAAYVYILRCADDTLYTGWTDDPARRLNTHNAGKGARYTRSRLPVTLVYCEQQPDKNAALRREIQIKAMTRQQKLCLIENREKEKNMATIPTVDEARALVMEYNTEDFHLRHAAIVSGVLRWFAAEYDPGREDYWAAVGMLHDVDFEQWPDEHCVKGEALLRERGIDEGVIRSAMSHGYGMTGTPYEPESKMEKTLFAVDELTGLIGAVAVMRPSKSVMDLELKSVKKKFKQLSFAAGCSRETISKGAELMGIELDELIEKTILAMRSLAGEMDI